MLSLVVLVNGIAILLKYKIKNNEICCSYINIRQVTKIIYNFVIHFINLFKNNGKVISYIYALLFEKARIVSLNCVTINRSFATRVT